MIISPETIPGDSSPFPVNVILYPFSVPGFISISSISELLTIFSPLQDVHIYNGSGALPLSHSGHLLLIC